MLQQIELRARACFERRKRVAQWQSPLIARGLCAEVTAMLDPLPRTFFEEHEKHEGGAFPIPERVGEEKVEEGKGL